MQHPDEGTIHSWLDGALAADEAARVEAHVKECPQCAVAVAEARGFIAGASRILTALDNAPRGVIPAAAPKKRIDPWVWRVAATVLVVAAGTLVVVRNPGSDKQSMSTADTSTMSQRRVFTSESASAVTEPAQDAPNAALPRAGTAAAPIAAAASAPRTAGDASAPGAAEGNARKELRTNPGARDAGSGIPAPDKEMLKKRDVTRARQAAAAPGFAAAPPLAPAALAVPRVTTGFLATDSASQSERLKVVGTPRRIGAKVTLYEVAPGDTVTLTEATPISLDAVVVTSAGSTRTMAQGTGVSAGSAGAQSKVRADAAATAKASDSSRTAGAPASAPPIVARALAPQAEIANILHAITWTDSVTKNTLTLTGRMPEARLQEIKIRIERERAAAAAKKSP